MARERAAARHPFLKLESCDCFERSPPQLACVDTARYRAYIFHIVGQSNESIYYDAKHALLLLSPL